LPSAWRIVSAKYASTAFDGEGARLNGGRWNSPGTRVAYAADSPSLAALELLVGLNDSAHLNRFVLVPVEIPDECVLDVDSSRLSADWRSYPAPAELAVIGDGWLNSGTSVALRVPTVVVPRQFNFLLNPEHDDFKLLQIGAAEPFAIDQRLLRKS
jgi:RES domain-containing protein